MVGGDFDVSKKLNASVGERCHLTTSVAYGDSKAP